MAKPEKSTSSSISGKSMSKSGKSPLWIDDVIDDGVYDEDDVDEDDGEVRENGDVIKLRGPRGEEEKFCPKELSADDGSAGERICSWKRKFSVLKQPLFCPSAS